MNQELNCLQILQRVESLLIRLGRAEEGQPAEAFSRFLEQHKAELETLNEQFADLQKQAVTLLSTAQSATPNTSDPPAVQSIRVKLSTIEYKLRELNGYWSGSMSLQRARRARSVPQSLGRGVSKSISQPVADQFNSDMERLGRSSSQSAAARNQLAASQQLHESGNNVHFSTGHVTTITQVTRQVTEQAALSEAQAARAAQIATTLTVPVAAVPQNNADLDSIMAQLREVRLLSC